MQARPCSGEVSWRVDGSGSRRGTGSHHREGGRCFHSGVDDVDGNVKAEELVCEDKAAWHDGSALGVYRTGDDFSPGPAPQMKTSVSSDSPFAMAESNIRIKIR